MKTIPELRDDLRKIAEEYAENDRSLADRLMVIHRGLYRRRPVRRAPPKKKRITLELRARIIDYARRNPTAHQQDIATEHGVNAGRVSEILAGFRDSERDSETETVPPLGGEGE